MLSDLGLPLGARSSKELWGRIIQKLQNKLASWKARTLSKPNRIILVQRVFFGAKCTIKLRE